MSLKLDFKPQKVVSSFYPPLIWRSEAGFTIQLTGFMSDLPPVVHDQESLEDIIRGVFPDLSLPEFARLIFELKKHNLLSRKIFEVYNYRDPDFLMPILEYIVEFPLEIQGAMTEKQFRVGDIRTMMPAPQHRTAGQHFLIRCFELRLSKSQTVEACELANELMGLDLFELPSHSTRETLIPYLKKRRFPQAVSKDENREALVKGKSWPMRSQVRWIRQGDQSGLEIKHFVTSEGEFEKFVKDLTHVEIEDLWKSPSNDR